MTWEERMSQRAKSRVDAGIDLQPDALDARAAYIAQWGEYVTSSQRPSEPDLCRECYAWGPIGNWPGVYHWKLACGLACGHAHHDDDLWIG